jgi:hypothetical protein
MGLTRPEREQILAGNAQRLLRLEAAPALAPDTLTEAG